MRTTSTFLLIAMLVAFGCEKTHQPVPADPGAADATAVPQLTLQYNTDENHKLVAESVQDMWQRNLKFEVKLNNKEWKTHIQDVDTLQYDIARAGWIGDFNDPLTFLDMFESDSGNNDSGWANPEYDALLDEARAELDPRARAAILQRAEELLVSQGPIVPLYFYTTHGLVARTLDGFQPHNRDIHLVRYMKLVDPPGDAAFVAGSKSDDVAFALAADPETFDVAKMSGAIEGRIAYELFEGLMMPHVTTEGLTDASQLVVHGAAGSHTVSEDGLTYTFVLRDDAKWSNGEPVTADDFVRSWRRVLTPGFTGDYATMLHVIDGAEAYGKSENADWGAVGVRARGAHTLEVRLARPTPYFLEITAFPALFPVPTKLVERHGDDWTKPENIVGNGAYRLESYRPQQDIVLKKSPTYWGAEGVAIDRVRFRIITDNNARVNAYKTGELHWVTGLPVAQISSLLTHPDHYQEPMLGVYYLRVNHSRGGLLADPDFRAALSLAIDRGSLVANTLNGLYAPASGYVPPIAGFESRTKADYDVAAARRRLTAALERL